MNSIEYTSGLKSDLEVDNGRIDFEPSSAKLVEAKAPNINMKSAICFDFRIILNLGDSGYEFSYEIY